MQHVSGLAALSLAVFVSGCFFTFEPEYECASDDDCDNGVFCDGVERCSPRLFGGSYCEADWDTPCGFGEPCDEASPMCVDCERDPSNSACPPGLFDAGTDAGHDAGLCAALACALTETCTLFPDGAPACRQLCPVGAEGPDDRFGVGAHGERCDPGDACLWAGVESEPRRGYCAPGNYNSVVAPNVGAPCSSDDECFSPYGRGACAHTAERATGICVVLDCVDSITLFPDVRVPTAICPTDDAFCRAEDHTCHARCTAAEDCPLGYACTGAVAICTVDCRADSHCRATESCLDGPGLPCVDGASCTCEPAGP